MATFDEISSRRTPATRTVRVPVDGELIARVAELEQEIAQAARDDQREMREPLEPKLKRELLALTDKVEKAAVPFTFQALGRRAYIELMAQHRGEDPEKRWDEDTFAPALIAACCVDPPMTLEQAIELWDTWEAPVAYVLFEAAFSVNERPQKVPFGSSGTATTPSSESSSTTSSPAVSPTPTS